MYIFIGANSREEAQKLVCVGDYFAFDSDTRIEGMRTGNQIILDDRLLDDKKAGERNFTIAHECGHDLINWQDPSYSPQTVVNYRIKSSRKSLVTEDDFKEWQANVVASCLLLRPNLVGWSMFTFMRKDKVTVFCDMKEGEVSATAWGCDLTYDYVKINGDYRS